MMDTKELLKFLPGGGESVTELAGRLRILLKHMLDKIESHEQIIVRKSKHTGSSGMKKKEASHPHKEKVSAAAAVRFTGAEPVAAAGFEGDALAEKQRLRGRNNKPELEAGLLPGEEMPGKLHPDEEIEQARQAEREVKDQALAASLLDEEDECQKHNREVASMRKEAFEEGEATAPEDLEAEEASEEDGEEESKKKEEKSGIFGRKSSKRK